MNQFNGVKVRKGEGFVVAYVVSKSFRVPNFITIFSLFIFLSLFDCIKIVDLISCFEQLA